MCLRLVVVVTLMMVRGVTVGDRGVISVSLRVQQSDTVRNEFTGSSQQWYNSIS